MKLENIAYCGFNCSGCKIFINTKENNIEKLKKIKTTLEKINGEELTIEEIRCDGCKANNIYKYCETCNIRKCAINKNIKYCAICDYRNCKKIERAKSFNENIYKNLDNLKMKYNDFKSSNR
ncbi:MAG: DUF3795 domain-containing protein [Candidatus Mcinerneyibacterium aminivorans]|uniref:DUF3795 domain-containing protein n=1 Tax=Candidatus Mcinerneyibacterium aminivorans TaxID=2703815 RepID=A0A5D0M9Q7_9BACT|nr:MAG: DUF3795 domain-containing protein [Candidatus Mcinerneyibacterium aminivorans]